MGPERALTRAKVKVGKESPVFQVVRKQVQSPRGVRWVEEWTESGEQ